MKAQGDTEAEQVRQIEARLDQQVLDLFENIDLYNLTDEGIVQLQNRCWELRNEVTKNIPNQSDFTSVMTHASPLVKPYANINKQLIDLFGFIQEYKDGNIKALDDILSMKNELDRKINYGILPVSSDDDDDENNLSTDTKHNQRSVNSSPYGDLPDAQGVLTVNDVRTELEQQVEELNQLEQAGNPEAVRQAIDKMRKDINTGREEHRGGLYPEVYQQAESVLGRFEEQFEIKSKLKMELDNKFDKLVTPDLAGKPKALSRAIREMDNYIQKKKGEYADSPEMLGVLNKAEKNLKMFSREVKNEYMSNPNVQQQLAVAEVLEYANENNGDYSTFIDNNPNEDRYVQKYIKDLKLYNPATPYDTDKAAEQVDRIRQLHEKSTISKVRGAINKQREHPLYADQPAFNPPRKRKADFAVPLADDINLARKKRRLSDSLDKKVDATLENLDPSKPKATFKSMQALMNTLEKQRENEPDDEVHEVYTQALKKVKRLSQEIGKAYQNDEEGTLQLGYAEVVEHATTHRNDVSGICKPDDVPHVNRYINENKINPANAAAHVSGVRQQHQGVTADVGAVINTFRQQNAAPPLPTHTEKQQNRPPSGLLSDLAANDHNNNGPSQDDSVQDHHRKSQRNSSMG